MKNTEKTMDKIVALCKNRGIIFAGSEIYGGLANTWDYGPLGVELKNNVKRAWWQKFVQESKYNVGVDCAILMNREVWVASGHVGNFNDPLMDCKSCKARFRADKLIEDYAVLCKSRKQQVGMLSGGNIQKVVVAREFSGNPVLILADQPTRGIDVGATEFIRKKLVELSRSGIAVLLISADLAEVMELSDSLIVMHGGKIAAYFEDTSTLTDDVMGEYMLGLKTQSEEEIRRVCHD